MPCLDDMIPDLHPSLLIKPSKYVDAAHEDYVLEQRMQRTSLKRGVDP